MQPVAPDCRLKTRTLTASWAEHCLTHRLDGFPANGLKPRKVTLAETYLAMNLHPFVRVLLSGLLAVSVLGCSAESRRAKLLERAGQHFKSKDFEKARIEYQNILKDDPTNDEAIERIALIWLERGSPVPAASLLTKLRTIAPGNLEVRLMLARIIFSLGGVGEAHREAVWILERTTDFPDALVLLTDTVRGPDDLKRAEQLLDKWTEKASVPYLIASANLMALRGDAGGARATYLRAVTQDPINVDARLALANFLSGQNSIAEARDEYKRAAENAPADGNTRLRYASFLVQTGATAEAVTYLTEMSRQIPEFLPTWRALVELAIVTGKLDEAQSHLRILFDKEAGDHEGRILQARLWRAQGDVKRAIQDLEKFGQEFPGLGIEKHQLALAYLQNNDGAAAIKALQEVVGLNPDNMDAQVQLAQLHLRAGAPQPAGIAMLEVVNRRPAYVPAYPVLTDALRAIDRVDQAALALERGVKLVPKSFQLHYLLGAVRVQLQRAEARQSFETVLTLEPNHAPAMAALIELDLREGKSASALQRAENFVAKAPNSAAARFFEARVYMAQKDWERAEQSLLKATELEPNHVAAYALLAEIYRARKDDPATAGHVESLLAKRPGNQLVVMLAGQYYTHDGHAEKARVAYEGFLATKPDAADVLNNLANLHADQLKNLDRALEAARQARAAAPASPAIADTLGWILYQKKAYAEALPLLRESADKIGQVAEVQYHLGMVNLKLGNDDAARTALRLAVAGAVGFSGKEEARSALAELEMRLPAKAP